MREQSPATSTRAMRPPIVTGERSQDGTCAVKGEKCVPLTTSEEWWMSPGTRQKSAYGVASRWARPTLDRTCPTGQDVGPSTGQRRGHRKGSRSEAGVMITNLSCDVVPAGHHGGAATNLQADHEGSIPFARSTRSTMCFR